jgi:hypothetical protein
MSVTCGRSVVSSTNKTDRHDITEILLKVVLNTITPNSNPLIKKRLSTEILLKVVLSTINLTLLIKKDYPTLHLDTNKSKATVL